MIRWTSAAASSSVGSSSPLASATRSAVLEGEVMSIAEGSASFGCRNWGTAISLKVMELASRLRRGAGEGSGMFDDEGSGSDDDDGRCIVDDDGRWTGIGGATYDARLESTSRASWSPGSR